jgi:site-specific DNA-cytosine methylase
MDMKTKNRFKILIGCEESQAVTTEFRKFGFDAYSCDLKDCTGNEPQYHIKDDIFKVIKMDDWKCLIAFPPCTHLALSGAAWFEQKRKDGRQQQAIDFFLNLANCKIEHIAIENPRNIMSKHFRKPDQIIQPYYFGDQAQKTTCLWLKNLPKLYHNKSINLFDSKITHTDPGQFFHWIDGKTGKHKKQPMWYYQAAFASHKDGKRSTIRSKTFPGIAKAMAEQWGNFLLNAK